MKDVSFFTVEKIHNGWIVGKRFFATWEEVLKHLGA